eukprot:s3420_g5.t1
MTDNALGLTGVCMASSARSPFSMAREDKGKAEESSEEEEVSHKASPDREEKKREPTRPRRTRGSHEERRTLRIRY